MLPEAERTDMASIGRFPVKTPAGAMLPLATVADIEARRGIDAIRHHNTQRTLTVRGDVDHAVITGGEVVAYFNEHIAGRLAQEV